MKRDMDLARQILLAIEDDPQFDGFSPSELRIDGRSEEEVGYHVKLLVQAGLIDANAHFDGDGITSFANGLTWQGHEFLETARSESLW